MFYHYFYLSCNCWLCWKCYRKYKILATSPLASRGFFPKRWFKKKIYFTWVVTAGWVENVPGNVKYMSQIQVANMILPTHWLQYSYTYLTILLKIKSFFCWYSLQHEVEHWNKGENNVICHSKVKDRIELELSINKINAW